MVPPALSLNPTDKTPAVTLDGHRGIFEISGRSLPENTLVFFEPILDWISQYARSPNPKTDFYFKLKYMNTSSSKSILDILYILEETQGASVTWCSQLEDEDMKNAGMILAELVNIPFGYRTWED